jgi:hypothetical protein
VVSVFEQLHSEGFLSSKRGFGTWVNKLPEHTRRAKKLLPWKLPSPLTGLSISSWDEGSCRLLIVIVLSPCNLNEKRLLSGPESCDSVAAETSTLWSQ